MLNNNKTALITGASRGIGKSIALRLAGLGYNIAVNFSTCKDNADNTVKEITSYGVQAMAYCCDVSSTEGVRQMINEIECSLGSIDLLVCNAGISRQRLFTDITEDEWDRMFAVNVKGVYNCCKEVLPQMIRRQRGKIITISSVWGITGASCEVHYSASKAAVIGFTKALAKEVGPSNITVNCIAPGVIDTDMNSSLSKEDIMVLKEETPLNRIGSGKDVADCVAFLAQPSGDFFTGQVLSPNGGFLI